MLGLLRFTPHNADGCGKGLFFSPRVTFQCRLSYGGRTPPCAIARMNTCTHVKSSCSPCQSSVNYGNTKTSNMHRALGSATLSQLAFLGESDPNFPWAKSQWDVQFQPTLHLMVFVFSVLRPITLGFSLLHLTMSSVLILPILHLMVLVSSVLHQMTLVISRFHLVMVINVRIGFLLPRPDVCSIQRVWKN